MRLSMSTDALASYKAEGLDDRSVIEAMRSAGFRVIDYDMTMANYKEPVRDGERLRKYLDEFGVTAGQAHAPGVDLANIKNKDNWRDAEAVVRFCAAAGIPQVVIHPSAVPFNTREKFFERNAAFYRSLIPVMEETGVSVLTENIGNYADPYYLFNGSDLRELIDMVDHPLFNACWDTGHANHFSSDDNQQYPSIMALGSRLTAIHFQDNVGDIALPEYHHARLDMHLLPYMTWAGSLNYDAVLKGLVDCGYKGTLNFEPSGLQVRRYVEPLIIDGREINALRLPPLRIWRIIYSALYETGKYMLETYDAFEE